jgi:hypothetical protein
MTTDKRQTLDNLLADIFREPPLISTDIEPAVPVSPDQPPTVSALPEQSTSPDQSSATTPDQQLSSAPDQPSGDDSAPQGPIVETSAVKLAEQAKSLLAGLNRDTAIRLRWAMRDIKAKRTKLTPVSPNDLEALLDLGFVEMRDGTPVLTDTGFRALD